jgi:hypothetical protein
MTKKNIQCCSLAGLGTTTALRAQGWCGLWGVVCLRMARVDGIASSVTAPGAQRHRLREDNVVVGLRTASRAWGRCLCGRRHHWLRSGKMAAHKGARLWSRTMTWRLRGLNNGVEAPGRTQRWRELQGGRRWRGLHGNFWREILTAWRHEWKPPGIRVYKGRATVYL